MFDPTGPHTPSTEPALFLQSLCPFNHLLVFSGCWIPAWTLCCREPCSQALSLKSPKPLAGVLLRVPCRMAWPGMGSLSVTKIILLSESIVSFWGCDPCFWHWCHELHRVTKHFRGKIDPCVDAEAAYPYSSAPPPL